MNDKDEMKIVQIAVGMPTDYLEPKDLSEITEEFGPSIPMVAGMDEILTLFTHM